MTRTSRPNSWIGADVECSAFASQFAEVDWLTRLNSEAEARDERDDMLGSEGQQRDDEVRPRGQLFEQLTGPDCSAQDATNPDIDIVATHWLRFQSASTLPLNGFLDVRKNKFDGPLTCSICLTAITAVPSESFIPWKPPESDGHLYRIHVHPCFSHLYIGELWQDRPEPSRADIPTSTALISDREAFYGRPSPDVENLSFISINQEH